MITFQDAVNLHSNKIFPVWEIANTVLSNIFQFITKLSIVCVVWQIIILNHNPPESESHVISASNIKRRERTTNILIIAFKSEKNHPKFHVVFYFKDWIANSCCSLLDIPLNVCYVI